MYRKYYQPLNLFSLYLCFDDIVIQRKHYCLSILINRFPNVIQKTQTMQENKPFY